MCVYMFICSITINPSYQFQVYSVTYGCQCDNISLYLTV